jgi:hypothetical protein
MSSQVKSPLRFAIFIIVVLVTLSSIAFYIMKENAINSNWRDFYKPKQQPTTNIIDEWGNYDDYLILWNEFASKNNLRTHPILTSVNKNNIKARLEDYKNFFEIFKYSLSRAKESSFLMSGDYFDFEWLIANDDNIIKVYKGKYDDKKGVEVII